MIQKAINNDALNDCFENECFSGSRGLNTTYTQLYHLYEYKLKKPSTYMSGSAF